MRLFDTHCHLDAEAFDDDREAVVARAHAAGVEALVIPGYSPSTWSKAARLAEGIAGARIAVGMHPFALDLDPMGPTDPAAATDALEEALQREALRLGAVAIGECGLDTRPGRVSVDLDAQRRVVDVHLRVARALCLPVILHCVHAHGALLEILEGSGGPLPAGGALHAFTGPAELIPRYVRLGLSFGLGGALTRPAARRPQAAARAIPLDRLLLETDAPDMPPHGAPERRNEPAYLPLTLQALAALRGEAAETLAEAAWDNARRLFGGATA